MDKNITHSIASFCSFETSRERRESHRARRSPSEKTLNFLRMFARNYRSSSLLPEGLPGFVLG